MAGLNGMRRLILQQSSKHRRILPILKNHTLTTTECHRLLFTSQFAQQQQQQRQRNSIKQIKDDSKKRLLEVEWDNGEASSYPHIFLRDNCQCPKCFHPDTKSRQVNVFQDFPDIDMVPRKVDHGKDHVTITWPDDHESTFACTWLEKRKFPKTRQDIQPTTLYGIESIPWDRSKMAGNISTVQYEELLSSDEVLMQHLENVIVDGVCLIKQAPIAPMLLLDVGKRMASNLMRKTHYGEIWDVKTKQEPNNLAYTSNKLPLHTDLPFYSYPPCIQMLHCIKQIGGKETEGSNVLADGMHVINRLRKNHAEYFELLSTVKVRFNDIGKDVYGEFDKQYERPVIGLDHFGQIESVAANIATRDSYVNAPVEDVIKLYEAYHTFQQLLHNEENIVSYKMEPGDILVFDNKRVLHGRTAFDTSKGERWFQGCYLDWDEVLSTYRILKERTMVK